VTLDLVIADDHDLVRAGFRLVLESEPDVRIVAEASNGQEAIERARLHRPDVVLMDVQMPGMDGIEATRRLIEHGEGHRVLILTTFERDDYIAAALHAGASGFLVKNAPPEQLIDAIRIVADGDAILSPSVTRRLVERFAREVPRQTRQALLDPLTERERQVLELVARGLSNAEIAGELFLGASTIKSHVSSILAKLDLRDRVQAVILAYEAGLVQPTARDHVDP
jgi:DNA-binding NarL/FixJ family response regulator